MSWSSAVRAPKKAPANSAFIFTPVPVHKPNLDRIVTLDFETYYDSDYTLRKLSTSEYIRDPRFKAHMVGLKIGRGKTRVIEASRLKNTLRMIPWSMYGLLCHNTAFDGFILKEHYGITPKFFYDTLSMARGLHKNDIGANLDEVAQFYGKGNKLPDVMALAKGVTDLKAHRVTVAGREDTLYNHMADYCAVDVELCFEIFLEMVKEYPEDEIQLIDRTLRMFCDPVLRVDIPRVERELERELKEKEEKLFSIIGGEKEVIKRRLKGETTEQIKESARKIIASNPQFAKLLEAEGVKPPMKISPAWIAKKEEERGDAKKWTYAFSKTDIEFTALKEHLNPRVRALVEARLAVKSTINETRAERFLKAGANNKPLPVLLNYFGAHTGRWSAGNKMNMQNLPRGGELRKSILAPKGHAIVVADSGQIEARVNAWLWGQDDLLDAFRRSDAYEASQMKLPKNKRKPARGEDRDAYCRFGDTIYGFEVCKDLHELERFVSKVAVLGLGYQMGPEKFQVTLALGVMGPPVFFDLGECHRIVNTYRNKNFRIKEGWARCNQIIEDMSIGRKGSWKCIHWEKERIWLPNGMCLKYPRLRLKNTEARMTARLKGETYVEPMYREWVYDRKDEEAKIYGGLLCENLVQALSRIIVAKQLLKISNKYRIVMFTHDENVAVARMPQAPKALDFMLKTMREPQPWCSDLPLNAEGVFDVIYSK